MYYKDKAEVEMWLWLSGIGNKWEGGSQLISLINVKKKKKK